MNAIAEGGQRTQGLFDKFQVARRDGRDQPGGDREHAEYFVLDGTFDAHAVPALTAYAKSCEVDYPLLAADLRAKVATRIADRNLFVQVPESTVLGIVVPAFKVGQYLATRSYAEGVAINADGAPWVDISYHDARQACADAGLSLITELQWLAIAQDIVSQPINWTSGIVGQGSVFQGLHKGTVDEAQPGTYESTDQDERRWHQLSNGERVFDFAGNALSWVFDNVQGDATGIVERAFAVDSPSIALAPAPSMEQGMGWRPDAGRNRSGYALVRGGCWGDEDDAGVFYLGLDSPDYRYVNVGFRCTK